MHDAEALLVTVAPLEAGYRLNVSHVRRIGTGRYLVFLNQLAIPIVLPFVSAYGDDSTRCKVEATGFIETPEFRRIIFAAASIAADMSLVVVRMSVGDRYALRERAARRLASHARGLCDQVLHLAELGRGRSTAMRPYRQR